LEVGDSTLFMVLFGEQRKNVAYFFKTLRWLDGTSPELVYHFCKVDCRNCATRVIK